MNSHYIKYSINCICINILLLGVCGALTLASANGVKLPTYALTLVKIGAIVEMMPAFVLVIVYLMDTYSKFRGYLRTL